MTAELAEKLQPCGHPVSQRGARSDRGFRCYGCERERKKSPESLQAARIQKRAEYEQRHRAELLAGLAALASRAFYSRDTIRRALCGGDLRYTQPTDTLTAADRDDMSRKCRACPVLFGCRLGVERDTDFVGVAADRVWPGNRALRLPPRSGPEKVRALYAEHDGPWRLSVIELGLRLGTTASTAGKWRQDAVHAGLLVEVDPGVRGRVPATHAVAPC